ncbi:MAG: hypothetical protein KC777_02135 [Cyanobacteria bacterium HKST-UBA02]|nr:hypothetical protein [Candidatus Melainabacteria bacterium]MCA9800751.1 hypothetical protein [Cyanobacteria bacterium HKST-UBA02]
MHDEVITASLKKRIEELHGQEESYWVDELYSEEALTNPQYREMLERSFKLDPLGPLPPAQRD